MRALTLVIVVTAIIFTGCKKDKTSPIKPKEKFPVSYQFINEGDENVRHVVFYTTTIFPNDTTDAQGDSLTTINWLDHAFNNVGTNDIVTLPVNHPGFVGCITQLKVSITFKQSVFSPLFSSLGIAGGNNATGYTTWRNFSSPEIVIGSPADNIVKFRWPSDTAVYNEVRFVR